MKVWTVEKSEVWTAERDEARAVLQQPDERSIPPRSLVLDIGCGPLRQWFGHGHEVTRLDRDERVKPDIVHHWEKLPFDDATFDLVYASHVLEHNHRDQVESVLTEWFRVLKPDGLMHILVPSLEWAAQNILAGNECQDVWQVLYGRDCEHSTGFTETILRALFGRKARIVCVRNSWDVQVIGNERSNGGRIMWSVPYAQL